MDLELHENGLQYITNIIIQSRTLCVFRSLKKCLLCSIVEIRLFVFHYFISTGVNICLKNLKLSISDFGVF